MSQKIRKYGITQELAKFNPKGQALKRKEISESCGVHRTTVSEWENAELGDGIQIGIDFAVIVARILGCEVSDLISEKGFKSA